MHSGLAATGYWKRSILPEYKIEKKHSDPHAFHPVQNDGWMAVSRFERDFNFDRYDYRIFGEVFTKNNAAFRDALEKLQTWKKLSGG